MKTYRHQSESCQKRAGGRIFRGLGAHWGWGLWREHYLNFQVKTVGFCAFLRRKTTLVGRNQEQRKFWMHSCVIIPDENYQRSLKNCHCDVRCSPEQYY